MHEVSDKHGQRRLEQEPVQLGAPGDPGTPSKLYDSHKDGSNKMCFSLLVDLRSSVQ